EETPQHRRPGAAGSTPTATAAGQPAARTAGAACAATPREHPTEAGRVLMTAAGERALYSVAYWLRRGDTQAVSDLAAALDETERAEARELWDVPGVPQTLCELPEQDLQA